MQDVSKCIDGGYFAKRVMARPEWLNAPRVVEICSASNCISQAPEDWIEIWLHNELGWFNHLSDALSVVPADQRAAYWLFAYRIYPSLFRGGIRHDLVLPSDVHPDPIPSTFRRLGFDSVNKSMEAVLGFECSPLSCNSMAAEMTTNEWCLFDSLETAIAGAARRTTPAKPGHRAWLVFLLSAVFLAAQDPDRGVNNHATGDCPH